MSDRPIPPEVAFLDAPLRGADGQAVTLRALLGGVTLIVLVRHLG